MAEESKLVIPRFYVKTQKNDAKTKLEGRPIFDEMEVVEVRLAGDRQTVGVYPAHAFARWITTPDGDQEEQTYAQRWPEQYRRFKEKKQQVAEGTPIDELPFLTMGRRAELKALSIYTAEALAALDGQSLKNIGQGGRELKNQAQAYLDNASGSAVATRLAAEVAALKQRISDMEGNAGVAVASTSPFHEWEPDQIKDWIEHNTGERPKGNPNLATLVRRADEISAEKVKAA